MKVTTQRRDGSVDVRWVLIPSPTVISYRGLGRLPAYVRRVLASQKRFASLIVSRPDGQVSISVWKYASQVTVNFSLKSVSAHRTELAIRRLADERGYSAATDYLANDGEVRVIHYAIPSDDVKVATFAELLLHDVFGIRRLAPLHFSYEETDDR